MRVLGFLRQRMDGRFNGNTARLREVSVYVAEGAKLGQGPSSIGFNGSNQKEAKANSVIIWSYNKRVIFLTPINIDLKM